MADGKKFLVHDLGIFPENAVALLDGGKNKVRYYSKWESAFPSFNEYIVGEGTGLDKVLNFWESVDDADCIVNFDVYGNDMIAWLRQHTDKRLFGSGHGAILENDRWKQKQLLKKLGLPVNNAVKIKGIPDLRDYLEKNKDKYVKIDLFRADLESFHSKDYQSSELIINEMENTLGPFNDQFEFIVEDTISADHSVEPGVDVFFNGKQFIKPYLFGYEIGKNFYIGKFTDQLAEPLQRTLDTLTPTLQKLGYRGAFSTEEKVVAKDKSYLLDICARQPAPLSAGYTEWFNNYTDLIWKVAGGEDVTIDPIGKYVAAMPLKCDHAKEHWVRMILKDEKYRKNVKFRRFAKKGGEYYSVPSISKAVILISWGDTAEEAMARIKPLADVIDAYDLQKDVTSGMDEAREQIKNGEKLGVEF